MAVAVDVKSFWGALLSVLLKCIAALGFTTPARTTTGTVAGAEVLPAGTAGTGADVPQRRAAGGRAGGGAGVRTAARRATVPAPRGYDPHQRRLDLGRKRTLPPTMKQRIGAEAHGSSPSARSLRIDDLLGADFAGAVSGSVPDPGSGSGLGSGASAPAASAVSPADAPAAGSGAAPVATLTR
ncbi:DUF6344 domain-containing protein [Actinacidiphila sp. DG2A-62]|uniref:DUF6344 domain-containing protein n=1 Tax=Actinacidiphila sp. DG2A-62 TaxID=3108821 RepID=UPI002DBBD34A|nr:DUF6344 domain-containing protein [Actinacidiphila sp. DG2A-62]MEC3995596.1 DUF6344 domain-containing protein [Actinacidiphila sp. DG2A-62]